MCKKKKKKRGYMLKSSPLTRPLGLVKATERRAVLVLGKASKYSIWKTLVCCCPGVREMQDGGSERGGVFGDSPAIRGPPCLIKMFARTS